VLGRLISFEGLDGVGKSTQLELLRLELISRGLSVQLYREPGGTPAGEALRALIKAGTFHSPLAELLAFATARAELVELYIRPALRRGELVLLDRFTDSSLAYQGAHGAVPLELIRRVNSIATAGLQPDLTLWLDLPAAEAQARRAQAQKPAGAAGAAESSALDSIEQRDAGYFERVREIFEEICLAEPERMQRIEVSGSVEAVFDAVSHSVLSLLEPDHG
jgi:dTMP kinase